MIWLLALFSPYAHGRLSAGLGTPLDYGISWRVQRRSPENIQDIDYRLFSTTFLEVRGGGTSHASGEEHSMPARAKMHPAWEGDCIDVILGACVGGVAGIVFSVALSRLASTVVIATSNIAFSAVVIKLAASRGLITVHGKAIRDSLVHAFERFCSLPFIRKLDARRRRRDTQSTNRRRVDSGSISLLNFLEGGGVEQLEEIATHNEHAVLGVCIGFVYGMVKGARM